MTKLQFWKRTIFWSVIRDCLAMFGMPSGAFAAYIDTNPKMLWISAACATLIGIMAKYFVDKDNDGVVDIFQKKRK